MHSVLATIDTEQNLWNVKIKQVFATDKAADIAARMEKLAAGNGKPGPFSQALKKIKDEG